MAKTMAQGRHNSLARNTEWLGVMISPELEKALERVATRKELTKAHVTRLALKAYLRGELVGLDDEEG